MFGNNLISSTSRISLPTILNGISKTLGVVNQAIPIYKEAKPIIQRGRTLFKIASEFNKSDKPVKKNIINSKNNNNSISPKVIKNQPVFFQ